MQRVRQLAPPSRKRSLTWPATPAPPHHSPPHRSIFAVLGHPGSQAQWPDVVALRHWREDTGGCRTPKPEHGSVNLKQLLWEKSALLR